MKKENIALGIFLVFVIGAGVYFYSSQAVPQNVAEINPPVQREIKKIVDANPSVTNIELWKSDLLTCRSEKYGYEFQYPKEWYLYGLQSENSDGKKLLSCDYSAMASLSPITEADMIKIQKDVSINFSVHMQKDFPALDMQGIHTVDELRERAKKSRTPFPYNEEILIDSERAVWTDFTTSKNITGDGTTNSLEFFHNGNYFVVHFGKIPFEIQKSFIEHFRFLD